MTSDGVRILLVGGGGREHALAWKLLGSPRCAALLVAPGSPAIESMGRAGPGAPGRLRCVAGPVDDPAALVELARRERIDLVVCGPEGPLVAGLGDACAAAGLRFFGPSRAAAEIEGSKTFAKRLMAGAGVPTGAFGSFDDVDLALDYIDRQPGNLVIKADGLCAGKGVVVTGSPDQARQAVRALLVDGQFGAAGARVVIEERLCGREVSMMALCDGTRFVLLASAEDHKAVGDGDQGPNTGGMGAYSPSPLVDERLTAQIAETIFAPTVRALAEAGRPFRGVLYGGLMLTPDRGPMVIEWNCRFGIPETQAVLVRLEDDLIPWLLGAADGQLPGAALVWRSGLSLCVVLAAEGYPGPPRGGDVIAGLGPDGQLAGGVGEGLVVFHAGTRRASGAPEASDHGAFVTAGGRVLGVTAAGADLAEARDRVYGAVARVSWPGMHFRRDIGLRENT